MTRPDFFVVGTGRSGTTLVRALLTGHPEIEIPSETGFVPRLLRMQPLWWSGSSVRESVFLRLAMANGRLTKAGVTKDSLREAIFRAAPRQPVDAVSAIFDCFGSPGQLVGDKTPGYVRHLSLLAGAFPEARFVRLVRHPLDVVASLRNQPWGPSDVRASAMVWRVDQECFTQMVNGIQDRAITVRLEDIVSTPQAEADRMAQLLGVQVTPEMFSFTQRAAEIASQNIHPNSHSGLSHGLRKTRSWEQEMTEEEASAAWALVQGEAVPLGYEGPADIAPATKGAVLTSRALNAAFVASRQGRRLATVGRLLRR